MKFRCLATLTLVFGCAGGAPETRPSRIRLDIDDKGLSGLTHQGGTLWTVSERGHRLLALSTSGQLQSSTPIVGVPEGFDLESIAAISDRRFAIGTESRARAWQLPENREAAKILFVERSADRATIAETWSLPFSLWNFRPQENQGIEGLCATNDTVVAGLEAVIEEDGHRYAPLALGSIHTREWKARKVRLTSDTGKLSALDCKRTDAGFDVVAVERHFGVMRLLGFAVDLQGEGTIETTLIDDLSEVVSHRNIEGVARTDANETVMIVDNEFKNVSGPNELVLWHGPRDR